MEVGFFAAGTLRKEVVRIQDVVANEFVERTVQLVGPVLRGGRELDGATSVFRRKIVRLELKLLDRIQRRNNRLHLEDDLLRIDSVNRVGVVVTAVALGLIKISYTDSGCIAVPAFEMGVSPVGASCASA